MKKTSEKTLLIATSSFSKNGVKTLKKLNLNILENKSSRRIKTNEILKFKNDVEIILAGTEKYEASTINQLKKLKYIIRFGSGIDNLDIKYLFSKKIKIFYTNVPKIPVSELTLALILNSLRKINILDNNIKKKNWMKLIGNNLYKKKIGIVGLGKIGRELIKLIKPFKNEIYYFDNVLNSKKIFGQNVKKLSINSLFKKSDIITLHLPLNESTHKIISKDVLNNIIKPIILINTSRAELIDLKYLESKIKKNKIFYATDVYENEPYKGNIINFKNTILSPHIGSYTVEERIDMENQCIKKIKEIINHK